MRKMEIKKPSGKRKNNLAKAPNNGAGSLIMNLKTSPIFSSSKN